MAGEINPTLFCSRGRQGRRNRQEDVEHVGEVSASSLIGAGHPGQGREPEPQGVVGLGGSDSDCNGCADQVSGGIPGEECWEIGD